MKRIRSLRSLFLGRTHPKPDSPIVGGAQRAHARRVEVQVATLGRAGRNRRPIEAVATNVAHHAIGTVAIPRRREEDGFTL